jgi:hypothetical protein
VNFTFYQCYDRKYVSVQVILIKCNNTVSTAEVIWRRIRWANDNEGCVRNDVKQEINRSLRQSTILGLARTETTKHSIRLSNSPVLIQTAYLPNSSTQRFQQPTLPCPLNKVIIITVAVGMFVVTFLFILRRCQCIKIIKRRMVGSINYGWEMIWKGL